MCRAAAGSGRGPSAAADHPWHTTAHARAMPAAAERPVRRPSVGPALQKGEGKDVEAKRKELAAAAAAAKPGANMRGTLFYRVTVKVCVPCLWCLRQRGHRLRAACTFALAHLCLAWLVFGDRGGFAEGAGCSYRGRGVDRMDA